MNFQYILPFRTFTFTLFSIIDTNKLLLITTRLYVDAAGSDEILELSESNDCINSDICFNHVILKNKVCVSYNRNNMN